MNAIDTNMAEEEEERRGKDRDHFYHFPLAYRPSYLIRVSVALPMSAGD